MENTPSREQVAELLLSSGLDQQQIGLMLDPPMEQNSEIANAFGAELQEGWGQDGQSPRDGDGLEPEAHSIGEDQKLTDWRKPRTITSPARSTTVTPESRTVWADRPTDSSEMNYQDESKDAGSLTEDDDLFTEAAPMLFGEGFEQKIKSHVEAVGCLRKSSSNTGSSGQYFRGGRPHGNYQHGGDQIRRFQGSGGGRRFQPYQKENRFQNSQPPKTPN